jgi:hypothetical protein
MIATGRRIRAWTVPHKAHHALPAAAAAFHSRWNTVVASGALT